MGGRDGDARRRDAGRAPAGFLVTSNLLGSIPGTSNGRCGALSSTADGELQGCSGGGSCVGGRKVGHRGGSNFCAPIHPSSQAVSSIIHHPSSSTIVHFSPPLFSLQQISWCFQVPARCVPLIGLVLACDGLADLRPDGRATLDSPRFVHASASPASVASETRAARTPNLSVVSHDSPLRDYTLSVKVRALACSRPLVLTCPLPHCTALRPGTRNASPLWNETQPSRRIFRASKGQGRFLDPGRAPSVLCMYWHFVRGTEHRAWSMEPRAWSMEPRAWSMEPRAWSMEHGAWSILPAVEFETSLSSMPAAHIPASHAPPHALRSTCGRSGVVCPGTWLHP